MSADGQSKRTAARDPWRDLAAVAFLAANLSWLIPWYRALTLAEHQVSDFSVALLLAVCFLVTYLLTRVLFFLSIKPAIVRPLLAGVLIVAEWIALHSLLNLADPLLDLSSAYLPGGVLSLGLLIPDQVVVAAFVLYLWWLALRFGRDIPSPRLAMAQFRFGLLLHLVFVAVNAVEKLLDPTVVLLIFLPASLLGLAGARIADASRRLGGLVSPFNRGWLGSLVLAIVLVVALAIAGGLLFEAEIGPLALGAIRTAISGLLAFLATPAFLLAYLIGDRLKLLWAQLAGPEQQEAMGTVAPPMSSQGEFTPEGVPLLTQLGQWLAHFQTLFLWLFLLILIVLLIRGFWVVRQRWELIPLELAERQVGDPVEGLRRTLNLQGIMERLRQMRWRYVDRLRAAERIRYIYASLLDLCTDLEVPRQAAQTPLEFLPELENTFATLKGEVGDITRAYVRVRYGEMLETPEEVQLVESGWEQVQREGKRLLRELKAKKLVPKLP